MARNKQRKSTIFMRLLVPLIVIVLLTIGLLVLSLNVGGAFRDLNSNALNMLDERAQSKRQSLQSEMLGRWSNLDATAESVASIIRRKLTVAGASADDMKTDAALNADIMLSVAPTLVSQLRAGGTTGIFVILNGIGVADQPDT